MNERFSLLDQGQSDERQGILMKLIRFGRPVGIVTVKVRDCERCRAYREDVPMYYSAGDESAVVVIH